MKLISGRQLKNNLFDVSWILWEHQKLFKPILGEMICHALGVLHTEAYELS